jgi:hypothetical protein
VRACPEIFFFCAFKQRDEDAPVAVQGGPSRSRFFFDIYIYIYFSKKEKRETLVADAEATPATAVVAFVLSMHHYDAQILSRFNPPSLVLSSIDPASFSFLSFYFFLVPPSFFLFSYSLLE